jgi:predicted alpha-1,2-mannosidase
LEAMVSSGMQNVRGTNYYRDYGYIPYDRGERSVPTTLAYSYDDWCISEVAKKLNNAHIYSQFITRAGFYANIFDKQTGFMRPKNSKGEWMASFNPDYIEICKNKQYNEENSWLSTWFVPHDPQGLINLFGTRDIYSQKLDSLFSTPSTFTVGEGAMIGQYSQANEASHHIAYLYNYSGKSWKTQMRVREIMELSYSDEVVPGLCGNEGTGQMSASYVMSAMGIYPVNPSNGVYVFGSPLLKEAKIKMPSGKIFTIKAKENSKEHIYIQAVTLNGKPYTKTYITHDVMNKGGELVFIMGKTPNYIYGAFPQDAPPSMSSSIIK